MHEIFKKSLVTQRDVLRSLYNSNSISYNEYLDIMRNLDLLEKEINDNEKKSISYKIRHWFKK